MCSHYTSGKVYTHMNVWFGCTTSKFALYKKYYFAIRNYLIEAGCIVLFDWLEDADSFIKEHHGEKRNIKYVYKQVIEAIDKADFSVIEYTIPNFSSSHQINYSLLKRKHTLVLRLKNDNENFADSYLEALDSPLLHLKFYTQESFKEIIDEFISYTRIDLGTSRYNIVLDKKHKYYLDWSASKNNKSRSFIIREALEKTISQDFAYLNFLKKKC